MHKKIILALVALSLTSVFCTSAPATQGSPTPDVAAMVNATLTAIAQIPASPVPTVQASPTATTLPATGGISGQVSFPATPPLPAMRVVAFDAVKYLTYFYVDTLPGQIDYTINGLPAGVYYVVSYRMEFANFSGGYTQMVPCGLAYGCNDHSLIGVTVIAGETTTGINPGDWYAPENFFPPMPNP